MDKPKTGDRVRIILEGEVKWAGDDNTDYFEMRDDSSANYLAFDAHATNGEIVQPPVVTFKPGDIVRRTVASIFIPAGRVYALSKDGYTVLVSGEGENDHGRHYPYNDEGQGFQRSTDFTSERYEKVKL